MMRLRVIVQAPADFDAWLRQQAQPHAAPTGGDAAQGAQLFNAKGCQYCHAVDGQGGNRGPDLTHVTNRRTPDAIPIRILKGGANMPACGGNLTPDALN